MSAFTLVAIWSTLLERGATAVGPCVGDADGDADGGVEGEPEGDADAEGDGAADAVGVDTSDGDALVVATSAAFGDGDGADASCVGTPDLTTRSPLTTVKRSVAAS